MAACRLCGSSITWLKSRGKPIPLDRNTSTDGDVRIINKIVIVLRGDELERARAQSVPLYVRHSKSCTGRP